MKKVLFVVCACLMAVMLAACGSRGSTKTDQTTGSTAGATASATSAVSAPDLPDKNGFDEATNTTETKAGVTVQVPEYYGEADDKGNYYAERGSSVALLMFGDEDLKGSTNDFSNNKEAIAKNFIKGIGNGAKIVESKDYTVAGLPGYAFSFSFDAKGVKAGGWSILFYNENVQKLGLLVLMQTENASYTYFPDFEKIVNSAVVSEEPESTEEKSSEIGGVDSELKDMLDSYEGFIDEYVAFMEKYKNSDDAASMLMDYSSYMQQYADLMQKINSVDTSNLSAADYAYYIEVTSRCSQKLLNASL